MTTYVDTSVIVSALTREPRTTDASNWMRANADSGLTTSEWVLTEVSAALSIKIRSRQITVIERGRALARLADLRSSVLSTRNILSGFYRAAATMADKHELSLRSGDSLHLAICAHYGDDLCTLDKKMADAGPQLGVATLLL